ncbi:MAG TPA: prepilin-type N-terminal cleavage/methylation domain-containing protein [Candidatus Limnocylindria bacterium]|nr:prepilin-type N-terminal cleavage/methylation domain-containing protein [Candidatus Limnocylindria bacterium]
MAKNKKNNFGFTLIEILLVIALMAVLAGLAVPIAWSFSTKNDLDVATGIFAQSLRRAENLAALGSNDSPWGVNLESQSVTIFEGASFASRDQSLDEVYNLPIAFTFSGPTEIVFNKFSGSPETTGSVVLTTSFNQSRTVSLNQLGLVSY